MTYVCRSHTKTNWWPMYAALLRKQINFFRCVWLIDITTVISISYDYFSPRSNDLWPTDYTFFVSSQLTTSIERRDIAITNNTPGQVLWTRGYPIEDHQIRSGNWNPSVKANEKKKNYTDTDPVIAQHILCCLVIHFFLIVCDLFEWKQICSGFYYWFILYCRWRPKLGGVIGIHLAGLIPPQLCFCRSSLGLGFQHHSSWSFRVQWHEARDGWDWWNC